MFQDKKILIGITGSIAAYKTILLVRELVKAGAEVKVVMTPPQKILYRPLLCQHFQKTLLLLIYLQQMTPGPTM